MLLYIYIYVLAFLSFRAIDQFQFSINLSKFWREDFFWHHASKTYFLYLEQPLQYHISFLTLHYIYIFFF